ncbi:MAG: transposase [Stellaceae bacterium]
MLCPAGQRLPPYSSSLLRGIKKINYANKQACRACPIRARCTRNRFRSVSRLENKAVLDRMQARRDGVRTANERVFTRSGRS